MTLHLDDERLDAAADGEQLDEAAAAHLRACGACRAQVERLRALRLQLAALPATIATGSDLWPNVRQVIVTRRARRRAFATGASLALAAALLIAVVQLVPRTDGALRAPLEAASSELAELRGVVPPPVVDAMAANLSVYDAALKELQAHAAIEGDNADVQHRIDQLRRKRAALLRVATNS